MERAEPRARVVAFYLPQYHPIPENDVWWGRGFTEWTNVARARPMFRGHWQPRLPADLGFYDLRVPAVRESQANLARRYGVEAFCYWHYWFEGRRILEQPFRAVLESGQPQFPFMLGWANQSWTGIWHGAEDRILIEQTYPGLDDHRRHFDALEAAFHDPRYLRVDGRPAFYIYHPHRVPDLAAAAEEWRKRAEGSGLPGIYLIGGADRADWERLDGLDAMCPIRLHLEKLPPWRRRLQRATGRPLIYDYARLWDRIVPDQVRDVDTHPGLVPNWDNTPRSGPRGRILLNTTPEHFGKQVRRAISLIEHKPSELRLLFVKSWNEWAEGNYLEPDHRYGHGWLQALAAPVLGHAVGEDDDRWYVNTRFG